MYDVTLPWSGPVTWAIPEALKPCPTEHLLSDEPVECQHCNFCQVRTKPHYILQNTNQNFWYFLLEKKTWPWTMCIQIILIILSSWMDRVCALRLAGCSSLYLQVAKHWKRDLAVVRNAVQQDFFNERLYFLIFTEWSLFQDSTLTQGIRNRQQ